MIDDNFNDDLEDLQDLIAEQKGQSVEKESHERKKQKIKEEPSEAEVDEEQKYLEKLVFGDKPGLIKNLKRAAGEDNDERNDYNEAGVSEIKKKNKKRKPAWHDEEDEEILMGDVTKNVRYPKSLLHINERKSYKEHLQNKYHHIISTPKWANLDKKPEYDSDDELLQTVGHLATTTKTKALPQYLLKLKKLEDLNRDSSYVEGSISSVQFHPSSTAALITGYSGLATIYALDGDRNEKLHSIQFKNFPITCAKILHSGTEALIGGSKNYYYSYNLMKAEESRIYLPKTITKLTKFELSPCQKYFAIAGRFGEVHLMDLRTKELIHTFQQDNPCTSLQFTKDSQKLLTHSQGPEVSIFDLRQEKMEHKFMDDGCINGKTISLNPNNSLLATGSNEGVVNIYKYDDIFQSNSPRPEKNILNLTTSITYTRFNSSSEILGMCSAAASAAVKLVHFPSGTVFTNFPGNNHKIGAIKILEFSPNSGFLALGSKSKQVYLYRLKHFDNY